MNLFLTADDVWLFRDGRPFSAGDDRRAASLFPPSPRTLVGVLRSQVLLRSGADLREYARGARACSDAAARAVAEHIGWPESDRLPFTFRGPVLAREEGDTLARFFAHPQDLIRQGPHWVSLCVGARLRANWPNQADLRPLHAPPGEPEKFSPGWLGETSLSHYLQGRPLPAGAVVAAGELYSREFRYGVHLAGHEKRPEEGHLYAVEYIRPATGVGLLSEVTGLALPSGGILAIGGEGGAGHCAPAIVGVEVPAVTPAAGHDGTRFKLYLATPALFAGGWRPGWIDPHSLKGTWNGIEVELLAAANGRPLGIGGYDLALNRQRALRRAVPAGSVYYFRSAADPAAVTQAFHGQCVSDDAADCGMGYGMAFVGEWQEETGV